MGIFGVIGHAQAQLFMKRKHVLLAVVIIVCGFIAFFMLKPETDTSSQTMSVSYITQDEFYSYVNTFRIADQLVNYRNLPQEELDKYKYLIIDCRDVCEEFNVPVQYGALLIVSDSQIERVIPYVHETTFSRLIYKYSVQEVVYQYDVQEDRLIVFGLLLTEKTIPLWPRYVRRSSEHFIFRWQVPEGMTFNKNSINIIHP